MSFVVSVNSGEIGTGRSQKSRITRRWLFLLLSTLIMVFYSEKMYWYIQGYTLLELVFFYVFGVYLLFWTISYFRINDFWPFVLASVTYPLYVEGLFTGIITFDLTFVTMLSYFIGWHATLAVIIGWFYHRKWLITNNSKALILSSMILGLLWGVWSIIYWSPSQINDPDFKDDAFRVGQWTIAEFAALAFYLTFVYIISHLLLSKQSIWQAEFKPTKGENYLILSILALFFIIQILVAGLFVILLILHFTIVFYVLRAYKNKRTDENTVFSSLAGDIKARNLLYFAIMPIVATSTYAILFYIDPPVWFIDNFVYLGIVGIQVIYGFILYLASIKKSLGWKTVSIKS